MPLHPAPALRRNARQGHAAALLLALCSAAVAVPAHAAAATPPAATAPAQQASVGMLALYDLAQQHDAQWRAAQASAAAQRERLPIAQAQWRPQISLSLARQHNDLSRTQSDLLGRPVTLDERYYSHNQTLSLRQPLLRPALSANLRQARALVSEAEARLEQEQLSLAERLLVNHLQALLALEQQHLLQVEIELVRAQLQSARRALELGSGTRTDIDAAQARLDQLNAQALQAAQQVQITRRQLESMTQQPLHGELLRPNRQQLPLPAMAGAELEAWLERARSQSPQLQALQARLDAARHEVAKARSGHWPTLDAVAQITRSSSETVTSPHARHSNTVLGLQFNWPLYSGGGQSAIVRQALAEQTRAEEELQAALRELELRVEREWSAVVQGQERIRAQQQAVRSAAQLVISSRRSFEAGVRTVIDILNAEQLRQQAELDLANAFYEFVLADFRLHSLAGADPRQAIAAIDSSWQASLAK